MQLADAAFKSSLQDVEDFEEKTAARFYGMQPPKATQPGDLYELPPNPHRSFGGMLTELGNAI